MTVYTLHFSFSPEGRRFRTRSDIRAFLEDKTDIKYSDAIFDFSLSKRSRRSVTHSEIPRKAAAEVKVAPPVEAPPVQIKEEEVEGTVLFYLFFLCIKEVDFFELPVIYMDLKM